MTVFFNIIMSFYRVYLSLALTYRVYPGRGTVVTQFNITNYKNEEIDNKSNLYYLTLALQVPNGIKIGNIWTIAGIIICGLASVVVRCQLFNFNAILTPSHSYLLTILLILNSAFIFFLILNTVVKIKHAIIHKNKIV
jgi:hypothetical protein